MVAPIIIACTLVFCAWLAYEKNKHTRLQRAESKKFWQREEQANHTRNKDISQLEYFSVDSSTIPSNTYNSQQIELAKNQIFTDLEKKMIDLSGYSNTDLKLAYGVGNFSLLSTYDANYNTFLLHLSQLATAYRDEEYWDDAENCYHLCLKLGSQKISDYTGLAKTYLATDRPEEVSALISEISNSTMKRKASILKYLRNCLATYQ